MIWFTWTFGVLFFTLYLVCLFTVCMLTFRKGYVLLGIIGIFFPILWLVGAILPAKPGSRYAVDEGVRMQRQIQQMTS